MNTTKDTHQYPYALKSVLPRAIIIAGVLIGAVAGLPQSSASIQDSFSSINLSASISQNGVLSLSGTNIASLSAWSNDELTELVNALDAIPTISADSLPLGATCWSFQNPTQPPLPSDTIGVGAWPLSDGGFLLNDLNFDYNAVSASPMGMTAMDSGSSGPPGFGNLGSGGIGDDLTNLYSIWNFNTNLLWLQITNVSAGTVYANLYNATNQVYAVWSTTNLALPFSQWQVADELINPNTNCQPFSVPTLGENNLLLKAEDWTSVDTHGDGVPDWWIWEYFGNLSETATNLDTFGNTLLFDYANNYDPNVLAFSITITNSYVNTISNVLPIHLTAGRPYYAAVLLNNTSTTNAVWQNYNDGVMAALNAGDGTYNLEVGLRGFPIDSPPVWESGQLILDTVPPKLSISDPIGNTVSQSIISIHGFANKRLTSITYNVANAAGIQTNQIGYITGVYFDTNLQIYTTNYFELPNMSLAAGTNLITLCAVDLAGNSTEMRQMISYVPPTSVPIITLVWPQDGLSIGGNTMTIQAQVSDISAKVSAVVNGQTIAGTIETSGLVWIQGLPLSDGTNAITLLASNVFGVECMQFGVISTDVGLTVQPLSLSGQINQSTVTVFGTINDPQDDCIFVNGVEATNGPDGSWEADGVPVSSVGMACLNIQIYTGDPVLIASQNDYQPQPASVVRSGYTYHTSFNTTATIFYPGTSYTWDEAYFDTFFTCDNTVLTWNRDIGGYVYDAGCENGDLNSYSYSSGIGTNESDLDAALGAYPAWEWADASGTDSGVNSGGWNRSIQTFVEIEPSGILSENQTNIYIVGAEAQNHVTSSSYFPQWLQIQGQPLIASGVTNNDGTTWGYISVQAPANSKPDVTPVEAGPDLDDDYSFAVQVLDITHVWGVDNNRDGQITWDDTDNTSAANPFRFWVNDASESGDISIAANAVPGSSSPNYSLNNVNGRSDLVNFFPVALCLSNVMVWLPPTNGWEYHLSQADGAVKFAYTCLSPTNAFDYLTNVTATTGYGANGQEAPQLADTMGVTSSRASGTILDTNWLANVENNGGYGVLLMEGCATSTAPLMLELWHLNQNGVDQKMVAVPLYLSIGGVEQMYRWVNLRHVLGQSESRATDVSQPANNPDSLSDGKNFVFVHGYNVNETQARGWNAEVFKRLSQSGLKAKFYGVTWDGSTSQGDYVSGETANYQTNVVNAFLTAPALATFMSDLSGSTLVAAHSLGNMVTLSAVSDYGAAPSQYFMIDAAVPIEAITSNAAVNINMIYPTWTNYASQLYASEWHNLWTNFDARNTLTWSNRLANFGTTTVYNFYSSGEDVLRTQVGAPPSSLYSAFGAELVQFITGQSGLYAWAWQEKDKGRMSGNSILSSDHGGWGFFNISSIYTTYSVAMANDILPYQLQTNAFFDMSVDTVMFTTNTSGSSYAAANRNRILSDAIPALTLPIGANPVDRLDPPDGDDRNFDMQALYENSWPSSRGTAEVGSSAAGEWHHSDMCVVAYPFTYQLFSQLVTLGNKE